MTYRPDHKPTLALMAGLPGAGKTTLAAALGRALQWLVLDKDWLKLSLLNQASGLSQDKIGEIAYELLFAMTEHILVQQQLSAILDTSARYPFILEHATQIAHNAEARLKVILCIAHRSLRKDRLDARPLLYHFSTNPFDTLVIENELAHFTHLPEDTLIVETKDPLEIYLPRAIQYLCT
jgi:predicted kinase